MFFMDLFSTFQETFSVEFQILLQRLHKERGINLEAKPKVDFIGSIANILTAYFNS